MDSIIDARFKAAEAQDLSAERRLRTLLAAGATDADVKAYEYEDRNGMALRVRTRVEARYAFADAMLAAR